MNPLPESFMAHVAKQEDGCWLFTGGILHDHGYRKGGFGRGNERWVHRRAYELAHGAVPVGLQVDHLCFVRSCVNPDHLEAVTHEENQRRAAARRPFPHGESAGWDRGCRCFPCCQGYRRYQRAYRARVRAEVAAGKRPVLHGTRNGYGSGCRCDECRAAAAAAMKAYRHAHGAGPRREAEHGTTSRYSKYRCRCDLCRETWNAYIRERRRLRAVDPIAGPPLDAALRGEAVVA